MKRSQSIKKRLEGFGGGKQVPLIVLHNLVDPVKVFADFCIDTRLSGDRTWVLTPGDDALKRLVTDQRASRVTLAREETQPVRVKRGARDRVSTVVRAESR